MDRNQFCDGVRFVSDRSLRSFRMMCRCDHGLLRCRGGFFLDLEDVFGRYGQGDRRVGGLQRR